MPFINAGGFLSMLRSFRVVAWEGRFGGGKTSGAFRTAWELVTSGDARYILSNCRSVWTDRPDDVKLRDGLYLDSVLILDEGGLFLKGWKDAEQFLAYTRKLNVYVQISSVIPPSTRLKFLRVQRVLTLDTIGLPLWMYRYYLDYGRDVTESGTFWWWRPSEVWGVYDTLGLPADASGLDQWLRDRIDDVKNKTGYTKKQYKRPVVVTSFAEEVEAASPGAVESVGSAWDAAIQLEAAAEEVQKALSVYAASEKGRRRRRR